MIMVLTLDSSSEHVAHTTRKIGLFGEKKRFVIELDFIKCLKTGQITMIVPFVRTYF